MMMMRALICLIVCVSAFRVAVGATDTADQCSDAFQKVMTCLDFAKGKTTTPSKTCCTSVTDIRASNPKCLCFIIQQTHSGLEMIKNMGIQESKLLQLPSACQLHNASVTECPKLLGLSPSSPDAAIFTSNATTATPSATPTTKTPTSASEKSDSGGAEKLVGSFFVGIVAAVFVYASA